MSFHPIQREVYVLRRRGAAQYGVTGKTWTALLFGIGMTVAEVERRMLLKTLAHFGNDQTGAARALGIGARTVHNHLARAAQEQRTPVPYNGTGGRRT